MKIKKLKTIILLIRNLLPMSRYSTYKYNKLVMDVLHAQTEMIMLNRSDVLALASNKTISSKNNKLHESKMDEFRDMYE